MGNAGRITEIRGVRGANPVRGSAALRGKLAGSFMRALEPALGLPKGYDSGIKEPCGRAIRVSSVSEAA